MSAISSSPGAFILEGFISCDNDFRGHEFSITVKLILSLALVPLPN